MPLWHDDDVVVLLSWLDFCRESGSINFWETIVDELKNFRISSDSNEAPILTRDQVANKLNYLRKSARYSDSLSLSELIRLGSSVLELSAELAKKIESRTRDLVASGTWDTKVSNRQRDTPQTIVGTPLADESLRIGALRDDQDSTERPGSSSNRISDTTFCARHALTGNSSNLTLLGTKHDNNAIERLAYAENTIKHQALHIRDIERRWDNDYLDLCSREEDLMGRIAELEAANQHLENARRQRETSTYDTLESNLAMKYETIHRLNLQKTEAQKLAEFFNTIPTESQRVDRRFLESSIDSMEKHLQSIIREIGKLETTPRSIMDAGNSDTVQLATSAGLDNLEEIPGRTGSDNSGNNIASITLAAVRDWILETEFPFGEDAFSPEKSLLQAYREIIARSGGGWEALRNLERCAHHKVLRRDMLQSKVLPKKASLLARRLADTIEPLISPPTSLNSRALKDGSTRAKGTQALFYFTELFKTALRLKVESLLTHELFVFDLHAPGTTYQRNLPGMQERRFATSRTMATERSWLHASLYVLTDPPVNPRDRMADSIIRHKNFLSMASSEECRSCKTLDDFCICSPKTDVDLPSSSPSEGAALSLHEDEQIISSQMDRDVSADTTALSEGNHSNYSDQQVHPLQSVSEGSSRKRLGNPTMTYSRKNKLPRTISTSSSINRVKCFRCRKHLSNADRLVEHEKKNKCFRCDLCDYYFPVHNTLVSHLNFYHHGTNTSVKEHRYWCTECRQPFTKSSNLKTHQSSDCHIDFVEHLRKRNMFPASSEDRQSTRERQSDS